MLIPRILYENDVVFCFWGRIYVRRILSMGFPLANSSISLSRYRISRIKGSSIFSIRTPQTVTFILVFIHLRSALKKRLVVNVLISLEIQFLLAVSGEPVNDFIYLIFCAVFTDAFMDKERVDFREGHLISVLFLHHSSLLAVSIFRPDGFADRKDSFPK